MAHFRGIIRGNRGEVSRLGSKASGVTVEAQSWGGKVVVATYHKDGRDYARIDFQRHNGVGSRVCLYDGPIAPSADDLPMWKLGTGPA